MKASIQSLWWNPWQEKGLDFDCKVSISVDNLSFDPKADYKILFLAEPFAVAPTVNEGALKNSYEFDRIFTFTESIIKKYPQAELFEWGSSWLDFKNLKLNKKPNLTFVTSSKNHTKGHRLRLSIYEYLKNIDTTVNDIEIYQHLSPPFYPERNDFFENAMFHVAVENSKQDNYFTEKIIDCFASKTIPIYYGCPNLSKWFDMNGVITFYNVSELVDIMDFISEDYYNSKQDVIEKNYEIAKQFHSDNDVVPRLTRKIQQDVKKNAISKSVSNKLHSKGLRIPKDKT